MISLSFYVIILPQMLIKYLGFAISIWEDVKNEERLLTCKRDGSLSRLFLINSIYFVMFDRLYIFKGCHSIQKLKLKMRYKQDFIYIRCRQSHASYVTLFSTEVQIKARILRRLTYYVIFHSNELIWPQKRKKKTRKRVMQLLDEL